MKSLHKICYRALLLIILSSVLTQCNYKKRTLAESVPRVVKVSKGEVFIHWDSPQPYEGKVRYKKASIKRRMRPSSSKDPLYTMHHNVMVRDLPSSTLYTYWLKKSGKKYTFQTEPEAGAPLSFLVTGGDDQQDYAGLIHDENCGFLLSLGDSNSNVYTKENAYVPVYYADHTTPYNAKGQSAENAWGLSWGDLRLVVLNKNMTTDIHSVLNGPKAAMVGVVVNQGVLTGDSAGIRNSDLHRAILNYNNNTENGKVAFVGVAGLSQQLFQLDGISYFSVPPGNNAAVIHVDNGSASVYFPASKQDLILKMPQESASLNCSSCNRLAQQGKYKQSIKAYLDFITQNNHQYNLEGAYFAVAKIYDEKLHQAANAHKWYRAIIDSFPAGQDVVAAKERLAYLHQYGDCNYVPLQKFELLKDQFLEEAHDNHSEQFALLQQANGIANKNPDCAVAPVIKLWVADQYKQLDYKKALEEYAHLEDKYPGFSQRNKVNLKIAETYSDAHEYAKAKESLTKIKQQNPELSEKVDSQLQRIGIYTRRATLRSISWFIIVAVLLLFLFLKPIGISIPSWKSFVLALLAFAFAFAALFMVSGNEIVEILDSDMQVASFFLEFIFLFYVGMMIFKTGYSKLFGGHSPFSSLVSFLLTIVFVTAGFYLLFFYLYDFRFDYINL